MSIVENRTVAAIGTLLEAHPEKHLTTWKNPEQGWCIIVARSREASEDLIAALGRIQAERIMLEVAS